jgi:chromosome segregation ATPase
MGIFSSDERLEAADQEIADLKRDLDGANDEVSELEGQVSRLETQVEELQDEIKELRAEKIAAEELAEQYKTALDEIESIASRATS